MRTYPIILAHGIARFDRLTDILLNIDNQPDKDELHYFKNIRTHLQDHGFDAHHTSVAWAGAVDVRARQLKEQIERYLETANAAKVHVVAHSMGGLDTRHALFDFRDESFHEKVASLTTIGTPHHGTPPADAVARLLGFGPPPELAALAPASEDGAESLRATPHFPDLVELLGGDDERVSPGDAGDANAPGLAKFAGLLDLTTWRCAEFNRAAAAFERESKVLFQAFAGVQDKLHIVTVLKPFSQMIFDIETKRFGAELAGNDGLVSLRSARWDDAYFVPPVWDADHLNEVGWWDLPELWQGKTRSSLENGIRAKYLAIAEGLAERFPLAT